MTDTASVPRAAAIDYAELPGPAGLPLLGIAHQVRGEQFHLQLEQWAREFGGRFRFSITHRHFIAITDPQAIASVLRQRPEAFRKGPRLVQVCKDLGMHGVFSANGEAWRRQRQLVMPALDPAHLHSYLGAMAAVTQRLLRKWQAKAVAGEEIDLLADLMRYTVDVTTGLAFGHDLNTLEQGDGQAIQQHLNFIFPALFKRTLAPVDWAHWFPDAATRRHVAALQEAVRDFIARTREQLDREPQLRHKPQNLIQALVATRDADHSLSDDDVSGNVLTMLLAGEDTTANTLAWLVWLLHGHPTELDKARQEVLPVLGGAAVPERVEQLAALDHLDACANEAMRLKPVVPVNITEAAQDAEVDGVRVPAGTFVVCVMRAAGMDPARFRQPHEFRPARWLEAEAEPGAEAGRMFGAKRVVMPFGAGPRVCPGRYLALAEIKMVMAMVLANFELEHVGCEHGEPQERLTLTMAPVGLRMRLRAPAGTTMEA